MAHGGFIEGGVLCCVVNWARKKANFSGGNGTAPSPGRGPAGATEEVVPVALHDPVVHHCGVLPPEPLLPFGRGGQNSVGLESVGWIKGAQLRNKWRATEDQKSRWGKKLLLAGPSNTKGDTQLKSATGKISVSLGFD